MFLKVTFSFVLILMLPVFSDIAKAEAEDELPEITFEKEEFKEMLDQETLDYLVEQADGDDITIHNVGHLDDQTNDENFAGSGGVQLFGLQHSYSINSKKFSRRAPMAAEQYASVARGKTVTIKTKFVSKNTVDITGGVPVGAGGTISSSFGSSKTYTVSVGIELKGPPKGYSSRIYYVTRFKDHGTFKLVEKNRATGKSKTYNKTYAVPSKQDPFVDWSRDIK